MGLIINYDPEADVLVLKLREGSLADGELLDNERARALLCWAMIATESCFHGDTRCLKEGPSERARRAGEGEEGSSRAHALKNKLGRRT